MQSTDSALLSHEGPFYGSSTTPYAVLFVDPVFQTLRNNRATIAYLFRFAIEVTRYRLIVWREEYGTTDIDTYGLFNPITWRVEW
jgi:hypothetical protein